MSYESDKKHQLILTAVKDPKIADFVNSIFSNFHARKTPIKYHVMEEAKALAKFNDYTQKPHFYINKALKNCKEWSEIEDRKTLEPDDLSSYSIPYLYFRSIKRRSK